jgi:ribosomal protein S18 acetylase RimI-like enzyme
MNDDLSLTFEGEPSREDAGFINTALGQWNIEMTGHRDYAPANFFVRDAAGAIRGGILAYVWGRRLHVDTLWLVDDLRGNGWGTKLLEAAQDLGREKGATSAYLDTFDWQARPFYERHGYKLVAQVDGVPEGHSRFYMAKSPL